MSTWSEVDLPAIDDADDDREGDGGGNALEGRRAIGLSRFGVDEPLGDDL